MRRATTDDAREDARSELIRANLRFAFSVAKQYQNRGVPLGDLVSEANAGLVRAADKYDPDVGVNFISYAVWWIRQALHSAVQRQGRTVQVPLNRAADLSRVSRAQEAAAAEAVARAVRGGDRHGRGSVARRDARAGRAAPADALARRAGDVGRARAARSARRWCSTAVRTRTCCRAASRAIRVARRSRARSRCCAPRDRRVLMLYFGLEGKPSDDAAGDRARARRDARASSSASRSRAQAAARERHGRRPARRNGGVDGSLWSQVSGYGEDDATRELALGRLMGVDLPVSGRIVCAASGFEFVAHRVGCSQFMKSRHAFDVHPSTGHRPPS